jgi:hypothetical protein
MKKTVKYVCDTYCFGEKCIQVTYRNGEVDIFPRERQLSINRYFKESVPAWFVTRAMYLVSGDEVINVQ